MFWPILTFLPNSPFSLLVKPIIENSRSPQRIFLTSNLCLFPVTSNQIERLWSRFTSLDKQQKGYLTREDFLRIPELAINPLGDRIVHAFFRDSKAGGGSGSGDAENGNGSGGGGMEAEVVNFCDFVRVLAHFRPLKKNNDKNKLNGREEKLRCEFLVMKILTELFMTNYFHCLIYINLHQLCI